VGHCAQAPTEYGFVVVYDAARDERREAIVARYQHITADPRRLDADCALRAALLSGLRTCTQAADLALQEDAARTYEYGYKEEVAGNLRAAALLAMSEVDDRVAAFHAVRLLPAPPTAPADPASPRPASSRPSASRFRSMPTCWGAMPRVRGRPNASAASPASPTRSCST